MVQIASIVVIFVYAIVGSLPAIVPLVCAWIATLVTLYAGCDYLAKNWDLVRDGAVK